MHSAKDLLRASPLKSKKKSISKKRLTLRQKTILGIVALLMITGQMIMPYAANASTLSLPDVITSYKKALQKGKTIEFVQEKDLNIVESQQTKIERSGDSRNEERNLPDRNEVIEAAEFASKATGVRKDFLIGMLVVESNLGQNTGKCTYQDVSDGAQAAYSTGQLSLKSWQTFQQRKATLKGIAQDLGYDYTKVKVSCNPGNYVGTGGAMGIPQFMPDTWLEFKPEISRIVGKENPDPWDVRDGVVAMAVKLAAINGVTEHNTLAERNAAKMYLSGTTHWQYDWYANQIFYWAQNYNELIG